MNELQKILTLSVQDRNEEQKAYLEAHKDEMDEEQKAQFESEAQVLEEYEVDYNTKSAGEFEGKKVVRSFSAKVKDLGNGVMEAVISSEALDRHGERIDMKGMDIKEYMKNPILADGHDYSQPSVGRTLKLTKMADGKLIAKFEWAKDISERARLLYNLYKEKFQFAFSIGFMAEKMDGNVFTKSTMFEFSPVLVPANPEALLLNGYQKAIDKGISINYNNLYMYELKEILAKELENLTLGEVAFLKENLSKLSDEEKAKFASVLKAEDAETETSEDAGDEGEGADEGEEKADATEAVAEAVKSAVADAVEPLKAEIAELKKADPIKAKDIRTNIMKNKLEGKSEKEQNALKFLYYARGVQTKNFAELEDVIGKDAMNTSEDGQVLPPAEFIAEVERLEEQYGVARRFATVRPSSNGNGITYVQGDDDLEIFDTAEGGAKKSSRMSYANKTLLWRKFAGILPITDELTEDSAVSLWNDATNRYARAFAQKEDQLVFTETSGVSPKNKGLLEVSGTNLITMSGTGSDDSFNDLAYDDIVDMLVGVPTQSAANGRFYFHREILGILMKLRDDNNVPLWLPAVTGGAPATILGKPYELVEVMPALADDGPNTPFMIFGDLRYVTLGERTGMNIKMFDAGVVGDPDEEDQDTNTLNLLTQDMQAMRAVKRMNAINRFPSAFSVLRTGLVNS